MTIVGLSDLHGNTEYITKIAGAISEADLVLLSGDLTHFGAEREAEAVIDRVRGICRHVYAVHGNCDYPGVLSFLEREEMSLHCRAVPFGEHVLAGIGGSLPCPGRTPNELSEEEFAKLLESLRGAIAPGRPVVFVSHQPPKGTLCDLTHGGGHVGSSSVRRFIEEVQPIVCFSGHIHEASGIDSIAGSMLVNPGPAPGEGHAWVKVHDRVEELKLMKGSRVHSSM